jgi:hypothetical protein
MKFESRIDEKVVREILDILDRENHEAVRKWVLERCTKFGLRAW